MDPETLRVYNTEASRLAVAMREAKPRALHALIAGVFNAGAPTADIGCGSGRDTAWLNAAGFPTVGFDASTEMLAMARQAFPALDLRSAALPDLDGVPDGSFGNVLCSAVLMHLPREALITAALNLARILQPGGRLVLSYRGSRAADEREADGRLYTAIPPGKLSLLLESAGLQVLLRRELPDASRPDVRWQTLVAEKSPMPAARGLERIQRVLAQDRKTATYKLALIRALCAVSRTEAHTVHWTGSEVYVPLRSLAVRWLHDYWPLVTASFFVAQIHGEQSGAGKSVAFRGVIDALEQAYGRDGLWAVCRDLDAAPARFRQAVKTIADTIRVGPVTYAGTRHAPLFRFERTLPEGSRDTGSDGLGWVVVPEPVWLDISRFDHWIEDSVVLRWAQLSAEMNPALTTSMIVPLLLPRADAERDTAELRSLFASASGIECVWSGRTIARGLQIDHAIPYAVWGNNDLWNLLPCLDRVNLAKRDALPTQRLLLRRRERIVEYWRLYHATWGERFDGQLARALGGAVSPGNWEAPAFAGLQETVEKLAATRGLLRWEP